MRFFITAVLFFALHTQTLALNLGFDTRKPNFLPAHQAFALSVSEADSQGITLTWQIADGYYLYQHQFTLSGDSADWLRFDHFPNALSQTDEYYGDVLVYRQQVSLRLLYTKDILSEQTLNVMIGYQGCADAGLCYPPEKYPLLFTTVTQSTPTAPLFEPQTKRPTETSSTFSGASLTQRITDMLIETSFLNAALTLFSLGLLLSFTPCVLPMIPIVSSIVIGHKQTPLLAFYYSVIYVFGMASTYALIGALVGFFGLQLNLQAQLQNPLILFISALLFALLALAMFGVFEFRLPSAFQNRLERAQRNLSTTNKSIAVFLSGIASTLVVSPCVSAPLAGTLLYISSEGNAFYGAIMLFIMALGMGIPLLLVGVFGPKVLPNSGQWLSDTKIIMGFALLGIAIWLLNRWLPLILHLYLWGGLSLGIAGYFFYVYQHVSAHPVRLGIALITTLIGTILFIGGAMGNDSLTQPLAQKVTEQRENMRSQPQMITLYSKAELLTFIQHSPVKRPILLDFYADWCISCKVIESEIFVADDIAPLLAQIQLVRLDLTDNTAASQELLREYQLFGPPALIFLDSTGQQLSTFDLVGEPTKIEVKQRLEHLLSNGNAAASAKVY